MKAWHTSDPDGENQEIIFEETRGKAIMKSEAYSSTGDFTKVRAVRADYVDGMENDYEKMLQALIDNGWWVECGVCSKTLDENDKYVIKNKNVYCAVCK